MKRNVLAAAALLFACISTFSKAHAQNTTPYWSLNGNSNASASSKLGTTNAIPLRLMTNNTTRIYITPKVGYVGVGTTNPTDRLHINSDSGKNALRVQVHGATKMLVHNRGGVAIGAGTTPPINGLYVKGNVSLGNVIADTINKLHVEGNGLFTGYVSASVLYGSTIKSTQIVVEGPFDEDGYRSGDAITATGYTGVTGYGSGHGGIGIFGEGGYGVIGKGDNAGVVGQANDAVGTGVVGLSGGTAIRAQGGDFGVYATSAYEGIRAEGASIGVSGKGEVGIYGTGTMYAGQFDGAVVVSGTFTNSDKNLKTNIQDFENAMGLINKLKPRYYEFKADAKLAALHLPQGTHYGLLAQDVEEVLPNLVKDVRHNLNPPSPDDFMNKDSSLKIPATSGQQVKNKQPKPETLTTKAVNYIELIPIMIKGMQEQQQENDELKARVAKLEELVSRLTNGQNSNTIVSSANVEQNTPNPVSNTTAIRYHIPQAATSATLNITNAKGQLVKTIALGNSTTGQVNVNTSLLAAGTYNYTLYVDGKSMDTKRMIVTH